MSMFESETDNLKELSDLLFDESVGPKRAGSIVLGIDYSDKKLVYEIMLKVTKYGMKKLFDIESIMDLTERRVKVLSEYLWAVDFYIDVRANGTTESPWEILKRDEKLVSLEICFKRGGVIY